MTTRRTFVKQMVAGSVSLPSAIRMFAGEKKTPLWHIGNTAHADELRIALIGKGNMGTSDTRTALRIPGVKVVAACDLYDARLETAKQQWGPIFVTKDYKQILDRNDVDVVIVATPDHWHQRISMDAMTAGKHVYCEKPVIHQVKEGKKLIDTQQATGCYFQPGSQGMASLGNRKARQLVLAGFLGKVNFVDGQFTGFSRVATQYTPPDDASEKTIWWDQFIGNAPKRAYDPKRFFQWRNWKDYGTGVAGDLFVHVLSSLHYITNAIGPDKVYATGGLRHQSSEFRDTPDILLSYLDYPDRNNVGAFTVQLGANYIDGVSKKWGSIDFRIVGDKGALDVEWNKLTFKSLDDIDGNALRDLEQLGQGIDAFQQVSPKEVVFTADESYKGGHYDHFLHFFTGIRNRTPIAADAAFAVQTAIPALLSNVSCERGETIYWDAENMKETKKSKNK